MRSALQMDRSASIVALCLLGHFSSAAQDVLICPGFEYQSFFGVGYLDTKGVSLGLRFPIACNRSFIELRSSYAAGKQTVEEDYQLREDHRLCGTLGFARSARLKRSFSLDYGLEAGYYFRNIAIWEAVWDGGADQHLVTICAQAAIRFSTSRSVQPVLSIHPFYEQPIYVNRSDNPINVYTGSQWGINLSVGVIFGLPSTKSE